MSEFTSFWEAESARLRAEINKLDQMLSGKVVAGNETGGKPAGTNARPCPKYDYPPEQEILDEGKRRGE